MLPEWLKHLRTILNSDKEIKPHAGILDLVFNDYAVYLLKESLNQLDQKVYAELPELINRLIVLHNTAMYKGEKRDEILCENYCKRAEILASAMMRKKKAKYRNVMSAVRCLAKDYESNLASAAQLLARNSDDEAATLNRFKTDFEVMLHGDI